MTWAVVARKDFADARRSRSLWALSAVFLLLAVLFASLYAFVPEISSGSELDSIGLLGFLASPIALFVAVASLVIAYKSVAGETESGSGKLLLGLPNSRRDVLVGKILGRTLVLAVPVVVGLVAMLAVIFAADVSFAPVDYALFVAVTLLFVLVYIAFFVGVSASTASTTRAATISVLALVILEFAWDFVTIGTWFVLNGFQVPDGLFTNDLSAMPDLVAALASLPPSAAYMNAVAGVLGNSMTGGGAWFLSNWFSLIVLALWAIVPAAIGYRRYSRADL
ncbi:ABC transporter permease subunit [Halapricum hydrolyticum]|uniref:ABC transporter permease n=1 Tax=Halapricum hydrolyticum TaxID=2979991 RepID=A0AAE3ICN8_9EURY|nr:ABC transporter permease subunit [Halapricum hydrolyticum]MCU4718683.1 ABC transporter permease [Halapricum hydrolyticum]MCU4727631.1 ABC transporter permease [Halapricum hydrolyticum]